MKIKPIESWIIPTGHSVKFQNLERNIYIVGYSVLLLAGILGLCFAIAKFDARERAQDAAEAKAIRQHHAVEVRP